MRDGCLHPRGCLRRGGYTSPSLSPQVEKEAHAWALQHGVVPPKAVVMDTGGPEFSPGAAATTLSHSQSGAGGGAGTGAGAPPVPPLVAAVPDESDDFAAAMMGGGGGHRHDRHDRNGKGAGKRPGLGHSWGSAQMVRPVLVVW